MSDETTQLPQTATLLAVALDLVEERLFRLPVSAITKNPHEIDVGLLDHLAWEHSVDVWDGSWPEEVKRQVIAFSAEVHRYKGTPHGIKKALMSFGVAVELLEWWEPAGSGVPGTFAARAFFTDPLDGSDEFAMTAPLIKAMRDMLRRVAPVSRAVTLQAGFRGVAPAHVGAFASTFIQVTATSKIDPPPLVASAASFAVVPLAHIQSTVTAEKSQ